MLARYWPAVLAEALGPERFARAVPLAQADRDAEGFGSPALLSVWLPRRGRGLRVLFNDPPDRSPPHAAPLCCDRDGVEAPVSGWARAGSAEAPRTHPLSRCGR